MPLQNPPHLSRQKEASLAQTDKIQDERGIGNLDQAGASRNEPENGGIESLKLREIRKKDGEGREFFRTYSGYAEKFFAQNAKIFFQ
ncbi:MAG TPA: hypothetical protein P5270_08110 [Victivallales bacterium]|nr:hypothetical protein [Victivallales bacterium]